MKVILCYHGKMLIEEYTNRDQVEGKAKWMLKHIEKDHLYPKDVPDTIFDILVIQNRISQDDLLTLISRVNGWILRNIRQYIFEEDTRTNNKVIIGYIACLNLLFPEYSTVEFMNGLKSSKLFFTIQKCSDHFQELECEEYIDWFIEKLRIKLEHLCYKTHEELLISESINNILDSKLPLKMKELYYNEIVDGDNLEEIDL